MIARTIGCGKLLSDHLGTNQRHGDTAMLGGDVDAVNGHFESGHVIRTKLNRAAPGGPAFRAPFSSPAHLRLDLPASTPPGGGPSKPATCPRAHGAAARGAPAPSIAFTSEPPNGSSRQELGAGARGRLRSHDRANSQENARFLTITAPRGAAHARTPSSSAAP